MMDDTEKAKPKLLCVDDEVDVLNALERLLKNDFEILKATSANEALTRLHQHPDTAIVLTDYFMAGGSGLELLERVKQTAPVAARALLSGRIDISEMIPAINESVIHRFILKPWKNQYLRLQMLEALTTHETLKEKSRLEELSVTDSVTLLSNHRFFQERIHQEVERAGRHGRPVSLIMIDIDFFKTHNDLFGHPAGDRLLQDTAKRILDEVRSIDTVARYGGEEFAVILPETHLSQAQQIAERIRRRVEAEPFIVSKVAKVNLTISLGVAELPTNASLPQKLIEAADRALYQAKRQGRNQTVVALDEPTVTY